MKRPSLAATVVAGLCVISMPAAALVSPAERTSITEQLNSPRWPDGSRAIKPLNGGLPTTALLPPSLRQPQTLLDQPPVSDSATRRLMAPSASTRPSASLRRVPTRKVMFASLKVRPRALSRVLHDIVFIGGLY
jgi:hypothetical protein